MIKYVAEFIGIFIFVSVILRSSIFSQGMQLLVIALGLFIGILFCASTSGGHINPAVSFAMLFNPKAQFGFKDFIGYVIAQLLGAYTALKVYQIMEGTPLSFP